VKIADPKAAAFVRYHLGRGAFGPLSHRDRIAWNAFVALLRLERGGDTRALREILRLATPTIAVLGVFVQTVAAVLGWPAVRTVWPEIAEDVRLERYGFVMSGDLTGEDARCLQAVERIGGVRHGEAITIWKDGRPVRGFVQHGWLPDESKRFMGKDPRVAA